MAIYHLTMKPISRSSGRSAVAAAAYRSGDVLENHRDGEVHDYTSRSGVEHTEIILPTGSSAEWARERSALWNAAEAAENRKDSRVAREIEVSLPFELSPDQRRELAQDFARFLSDRYGVAVDLAIHRPDQAADERNHHVHLLMTTRRIEQDGLGEKSELELENRKLIALGMPTSHDQLRSLRETWARLADEHLIEAGIEARIDHRSLRAQGLDLEPTRHAGPVVTDMIRSGQAVSRSRLDPESSRLNAERILERPELVIEAITREKSVFDRHDVLRTLNRYVDDREAFQAAVVKVMASPSLVQLQAEVTGPNGRVVEKARYSSAEMVAIERGLAERSDRLARAEGFQVAARHFESSIAARPFLSAEQRVAVGHLTGETRLAAVVGLAGAGKSTLLAAAREAWQAEGYRVVGAALSGKAAEGLQESAGIDSRTLASLEQSWGRGYDQLDRRSILVIDEAGMVSSRQLGRVIEAADRAGAKVVLVGDPEQLQPINAGAAFRAVVERTGFVELQDIRRQVVDWQRAASLDFGRHRTAEGLAAYAQHGAIHLETSAESARSAIVRDVLADLEARPDRSRLVLAHRRDDVKSLNEAIRSELKARGGLVDGRLYRTNEGEREFAAGDRLIFLENSNALRVKNGRLATVTRTEEGQLVVKLDTEQGPGRGAEVKVSLADYQAVDHAYSVTIHKSQGSTVDKAYVLASGTMDRHLTYVSMTRHREDVQLYAGRDEFGSVEALSRRLGRENIKETTLDYIDRRDDPGAGLARTDSRADEIKREVEAKSEPTAVNRLRGLMTSMTRQLDGTEIDRLRQETAEREAREQRQLERNRNRDQEQGR